MRAALDGQLDAVGDLGHEITIHKCSVVRRRPIYGGSTRVDGICLS